MNFIFKYFKLCFITFFFSSVSQANSDDASDIKTIILQHLKNNTVKYYHHNADGANSTKSSRIVGGQNASRGEYPEHASLIYTDNFGDSFYICGGTLIEGNKALTAAHCTVDYSASRLAVIPDLYSFNDTITQNDIYLINQKIEHPNYQDRSDGTLNNDISILILERSSPTTTANIFSGTNDLTGNNSTIIGFGNTSEGGNSSAILKEAVVPIVSNTQCQSRLNSVGYNISNSMLCAGFENGGVDTCQGDSGGPLYVNIEGKRVQTGITSFGFGCARAGNYGIYARISTLISFVKQHAPNANFVDFPKPTSGSNIVPINSLLLD